MSVLQKEEPPAGPGRRRRRLWSAAEKQQIVAETYGPGASVSIVARRHDLNANLLFSWRRKAGAVPSLVPEPAATFVPAAITMEPTPASCPVPPEATGRIEIILAGGDRVIVGTDIDAAALSRVIKVLSRR